MKAILKYFLAWRLLTFSLAALSVYFLAYLTDFTFLHKLTYKDVFTHNYFYLWSNFDGVHYLNLAQYGYGTPHTNYTQAFFPLFPFLIRGLNYLLDNYLLSALLISNLSAIVALFFFYRLARLDLSPTLSRQSLILLLLFPTSFFLLAVYNESLFLALLLSSIYFARRGQFLISILLAALASATRLVGAFLLPVLILEYWHYHHHNWRAFLRPTALFLPLSLTGLLLYMYYLYQTTADPFYFAHLQPLVGSERTVTQLIPLPQVFYRYLKILLTADYTSITFAVSLLELLIAGLFFLLSLFAFRFRLSYGLFALATFVLPTLTGTFSSLPRYVLVIFPAFFLLARFFADHQRLKNLFLLLSGATLAFFLVLFATGHFVG